MAGYGRRIRRLGVPRATIATDAIVAAFACVALDARRLAIFPGHILPNTATSPESRETRGDSHHLALWLSAMRSSIIRVASRFVRGSTVPPRARIFASCGSVGSPSTSIPRFWRCGSCRSEYWPKRIWRMLLDIMNQMALAIRNNNPTLHGSPPGTVSRERTRKTQSAALGASTPS